MPKPSKQDQELLRGAAAGESSALQSFYEGHVDGLYAFVFYRVGRDAALAEDVVQETFLYALDHVEDYDPDRGSLRAWLCTSSRNVIRRHLRAHRRAAELEQTWDRIDATLSQVFDALGTSPLSDEVLAREETRDLVNMTIANLPDEYRHALERKYVYGETLRDMAGGLDVSEDAVKSLLARARRAFREAFSTLNNAFGEAQ